MPQLIDRSMCTAGRHGDESAYSWWGCRCPDSREAWRIYKKRLREGRSAPRKVDATGTARRLQGLVAVGYSCADLAKRLGVSWRRASDLTHMSRGLVYSSTAQKVRVLAHELAGTAGSSKYALTVAARYGWLTVAVWDDVDDPQAVPCRDAAPPDTPLSDAVLVRRAVAGKARWGQLNEAERVEAIASMARSGLGRDTIARRVHASASTIRDFMREHGLIGGRTTNPDSRAA